MKVRCGVLIEMRKSSIQEMPKLLGILVYKEVTSAVRKVISSYAERSRELMFLIKEVVSRRTDGSRKT